MSRLIKSQVAASQVRSLDFVAPTPHQIEPDPRDQQLADQAERIAALEAELAAQRASEVDRAEAAAKAEVSAEARGRQAGLDEADERAAERISRLELGLTEARLRLDAELAGLERLAALLAETALARLVDDPQSRRPLIAGIIRQQMRGLEARALLRVEVSAEDFSDPAALEDLAAEAGLSGLRIEPASGLGPGACRLKLRLGELEVGLDQQWGALRGVLAELAAAPLDTEAAL